MTWPTTAFIDTMAGRSPYWGGVVADLVDDGCESRRLKDAVSIDRLSNLWFALMDHDSETARVVGMELHAAVVAVARKRSGPEVRYVW